MVCGLTIYACIAKEDFTQSLCGLYILAVFLAILVSAIPLYFVLGIQATRLAICCLGVLLFSFYIIWDTQMIMGGKNKLSFEPDEYILAALILYVDIIQLFLYILSLVQGSD